jgi:hypothetical protein
MKSQLSNWTNYQSQVQQPSLHHIGQRSGSSDRIMMTHTEWVRCTTVAVQYMRRLAASVACTCRNSKGRMCWVNLVECIIHDVATPLILFSFARYCWENKRALQSFHYQRVSLVTTWRTIGQSAVGCSKHKVIPRKLLIPLNHECCILVFLSFNYRYSW